MRSMQLLSRLFMDALGTSAIIFQVRCKPEFRVDFERAGGCVIGRERCLADSFKDYWLIDLSVYPARRYGDTLKLDVFTYYELVKSQQFAPEFQQIGARISLDFQITPAPLQSTGCLI